jgi:hypothetical protein
MSVMARALAGPNVIVIPNLFRDKLSAASSFNVTLCPARALSRNKFGMTIET